MRLRLPRLPQSWRTDALAGVSLAFTDIPQLLGYTRIAGMPAATGLYTALLPPLVFALFGASRHLVVAADSGTAAILSGTLSRMAAPESAHYVALAGAAALLTAVFLLGARLFRLGFLADFLSRTVLVGFLTGVGAQVAISMLHDMAGVAATARNPLVQAAQTAAALDHLNPVCVLLSGLTIGGALLIETRWPRVPAAFLAVAGGIGLACLPGAGQFHVPLLGPVARGLPDLRPPAIGWNEMLSLAPVAASCVFVIIAQSAATSRAFAQRFGEETDENADLLGLSAANAAAGLSGAFVVNGSPTQTAIAAQARARSQAAQVVFAALVLATLLFLTGPLALLPRCVLASLVFATGLRMIDIEGLLAIRAESPGEFRLAVATALVVVGLGVEEGILLASCLSLFRHVRHSYEPHTAILKPSAEGGSLEPVPAQGGEESYPGVIVFCFSADLFYANCERFTRDVTTHVDHAPDKARCVVVDCSAITDIDYTAAAELRALIASLRERGVTMLFGRVSPFLRADMDRHRITGAAGEDNLFRGLHKAVAEARRRVASSPIGSG